MRWFIYRTFKTIDELEDENETRGTEYYKNLKELKEKIKNLNVFVSHGTNDNIIPVNEARASVAYLKTLGVTPLFKEYPEAHTISPTMFADMLLWLKK